MSRGLAIALPASDRFLTSTECARALRISDAEFDAIVPTSLHLQQGMERRPGPRGSARRMFRESALVRYMHLERDPNQTAKLEERLAALRKAAS